MNKNKKTDFLFYLLLLALLAPLFAEDFEIKEKINAGTCECVGRKPI